MKLHGVLTLDKFKRSHADVRKQLEAWQMEVEAADWRDHQDIKTRYPNASFLADNRVIFNIKGNSYRLVVKVKYQNGMMLVEWIGTHAEYDKKSF
ncbi:MAG: type II toxin-antitoxin system HigB family toxin [Gallionella sp.]